uniref:SPRY domain-containing protein n=1 Tax=Meloidogyne incognita TaxID=6306 RepID=A0A914LEV0_MELIC
MEGSTDKKFGELTKELEQINLNNKQLCFVQLANKWKEIKEKSKEAPWLTDDCCEAKCINTEKPVGNCVKGNGFANLVDDENIEYIDAKRDDNCYGHDKSATIYAENSFEKQKDSSDYSLFYFEVKYIGKSNEERINHKSIHLGLENSSKNYASLNFCVYGGKQIRFNVQNKKGHGFDNLDKVIARRYIGLAVHWPAPILGCGLVYPPSTNNNFSYIFFTHNGKHIGC